VLRSAQTTHIDGSAPFNYLTFDRAAKLADP
jgi:hypothetical protein